MKLLVTLVTYVALCCSTRSVSAAQRGLRKIGTEEEGVWKQKQNNVRYLMMGEGGNMGGGGSGGVNTKDGCEVFKHTNVRVAFFFFVGAKLDEML